MKHPLLIQAEHAGELHGSEPSDSELTQRALRDPPAFGAIYQRYLTRMYGFLRARVVSEDEAADLTQEVFLRAFRALPTYQEQGLPFGAWLFRIARNMLIDRHRSKRVHVTLDVLPVALLQTSVDSPESVVLKKERLARLASLVNSLPENKQELLALRFAAGLTVREIAPIVGKSEDALKQQFSRTLRALKEQYDETE